MIIMRYEERPQSENKVLGEITSIYRNLLPNVRKVTRSEEYSSSKFKVVECYDRDGIKLVRSELVGNTIPYEYRVETYYDKYGGVVFSIRYRRIFDEKGLIISEEVDL